MAIDPISITAIIISATTTIAGIIGAMHLKKSNCLGNSCECYESEEKKIERIKSVIKSEHNSPIRLEQPKIEEFI